VVTSRDELSRAWLRSKAALRESRRCPTVSNAGRGVRNCRRELVQAAGRRRTRWSSRYEGQDVATVRRSRRRGRYRSSGIGTRVTLEGENVAAQVRGDREAPPTSTTTGDRHGLDRELGFARWAISLRGRQSDRRRRASCWGALVASHGSRAAAGAKPSRASGSSRILVGRRSRTREARAERAGSRRSKPRWRNAWADDGCPRASPTEVFRRRGGRAHGVLDADRTALMRYEPTRTGPP